MVLLLPYIHMNLPQVYMCSPSCTPLPPPSLYHHSGSSQCTSPKHPVSCIEPGLAIRFIYDIIQFSVSFPQMTPTSPTESLLFNMLSRWVIAFLPRSKHLNFMAAVTICSNFGAQENTVCHCFHCLPIYLSWIDGTDAMILVFECWVLSQLFHSPLSLSSRGSLVSLCFLL